MINMREGIKKQPNRNIVIAKRLKMRFDLKLDYLSVSFKLPTKCSGTQIAFNQIKN